MRNRVRLVIVIAVLASVAALARAAQRDNNPNGWQIPENARQETSPLQPTPAVLKKGKSLFDSKCARCHGHEGKGNGPDSDQEHPAADLTDASRASRNPDGVMFYKVWNGRKEPKMPAFKSELTKDDVWAVVEYAKSLRKE